MDVIVGFSGGVGNLFLVMFRFIFFCFRFGSFSSAKMGGGNSLPSRGPFVGLEFLNSAVNLAWSFRDCKLYLEQGPFVTKIINSADKF